MSADDTHPQSIPMLTCHSVAEHVSVLVGMLRVPPELFAEEPDLRAWLAPRLALAGARRLAVRP